MRLRSRLFALATVLAALPLAAQADDMFAGRTVTVYVSTGPGGGYDAYGRILSRSLGRHLPGDPKVITENMPGAGGRKLANFLYNAAPKDGSVIAIIHHTTVYDALFGEKGVKYDSRKFNWLGSIASFTSVGIASRASGIKTIADARKKQIAMGSSGVGATSFQYTNLMNHVAGTKFKIITGYKGAADMFLALEKGELQGLAGVAWSTIRNHFGKQIKSGDIDVFVQFALKKHPELPNVPLIGDAAESAKDKAVLRFVFAGLDFARPFLAPPGLPAATVTALRRGFDQAARDPELLAQAKKAKLDIDPVDGAKVQKLVAELYDTPKDVVERAHWALTAK
jgi:tripartite-type tricarboxylate transporter receptor subunit TctC